MFLTDKLKIMSVPPVWRVACNPMSICISSSVYRIPQKYASEKLSQNFFYWDGMLPIKKWILSVLGGELGIVG